MAVASVDPETYIEFIKSCYYIHPNSFSYYNRLIDHLRDTSLQQPIPQSRLQELKAFEVLAPIEHNAYPNLFPFQETTWANDCHRPKIIILEGFPSPSSIALLGTKWQIRPEFFISHLPVTHGSLYEIPSPLYLRNNLVRVHFVSLFKSMFDRSVTFSITKQRSELEQLCKKQEKELIGDRKYGATRFRRVNLHDSQVSSIEQTISMTVAEGANGWTGLNPPYNQ
ncbi:hypothetical protein F5Y08DRAFT_354918 [Xylaria arbuscula]|nr:hypothetical protein F5Y08DRAFT_354918 [Xylaria arbuscula]